jgi:hypothetical protein
VVKRAQTKHNKSAEAVNPAQNGLIYVFKERFMTCWGKAVGFFMTHPTFYAFGFKKVA